MEENLLGQVDQYSEIQSFTSKHGIVVQNWRTQHNKNSQFFGVTAMRKWFEDKVIALPYASDSRDETDKLCAAS